MEGAPRVLDASALIALLLRERGEDAIRAISAGSLLSTVNWAEVLQAIGVAVDAMSDWTARVEAIGIEVVPFSAEHAQLAAAMREATAAAGLSLADRACLALARERGAIAVTGDRAWDEVDVGVEVMQFR